jgi:tRNA pseudouridine55 synthase
VNGILNILKPPGMTSFDVVAHIRGLTGTKKVGHTGTLDPLAAGVLTVCAGSATGAIEFLADKDKLYRAELTLGISTDTQDSTGTVLSESPVTCSDSEIEAAILSFVGSYEQMPPMYSALKHNGKKLYELAREGVSVERAPRRVEIYSADLRKISREDRQCGIQNAGSIQRVGGIQSAGGKVKVLFDIHCSKGTYIRTLCADIGERLGCGGHMSFLLRKKAGIFTLEEAYTLEELKALASEGGLQAAMTDAERAFSGLEDVELDAIQERKFVNGMRITIVKHGTSSPCFAGLVRVYGADGSFLALGELYEENGGRVLKSRKFF